MVFSLSLPPVLVLFGSIDRELAWFIIVSEVEIGPEIDNDLLLLDFI